MCTLKELEEYYSFSDVLDMCEVIAVHNANENEQYKELERKRKMRG